MTRRERLCVPWLFLRSSVLREVCKPLPLPSVSTAATQLLARQMIATMQRASGVGLAAPQVGIPSRMFVAELDDGYDHPEDEDASTASAAATKLSGLLSLPPRPSIIINPVIHKSSTRTRFGVEGCLSLPGLVGSLARPVSIDVSYLDERGILVRRTFTDFRARLFQHEYDHLNGKLFIDHIDQIQNIWTVRVRGGANAGRRAEQVRARFNRSRRACEGSHGFLGLFASRMFNF